MGLNIIDNTSNPAKNAMGGTELMMKWLHENVDNELLNQFQIIPSRVRELEDKPRILWCHDLAQDPEVSKLQNVKYRENFDKFVFVSHWQQQQYEDFLGVPPSKCVVLKNAIYPIEQHEKPKDKINLIYHTTPHRGLDLLVPAFQRLKDEVGNVHLDVYSSFNIYGWGERDKQYKHLFDACEKDEEITYHGSVSNDEIREALTKAHIFAYPNIWKETACIAAIEAMSAGCLVVCPTLAALPETTMNFSWMYPYTEEPRQHIDVFYRHMKSAVECYHTDAIKDRLHVQKMMTDSVYNWKLRGQDWTAMLKELKNVRG